MWKMSDSAHCQMPAQPAIQGLIGKENVPATRSVVTPANYVTVPCRCPANSNQIVSLTQQTLIRCQIVSGQAPPVSLLRQHLHSIESIA
jgi:hypothetical protein